MLILKVFKIIVNIEQNIVIDLCKIYYEKEAICIYGGKMKLLKIGVKIFGLVRCNIISIHVYLLHLLMVFISFYDKTHENKVHVLMKNTESRDIQSLIAICSQSMET